MYVFNVMYTAIYLVSPRMHHIYIITIYIYDIISIDHIVSIVMHALHDQGYPDFTYLSTTIRSSVSH